MNIDHSKPGAPNRDHLRQRKSKKGRNLTIAAICVLLLGAGDIGLVHDNHRGGQMKVSGDPAVTFAELLRRVEHQRCDIHVVGTSEGSGIDALAKRGDRLVQARGVDEHELMMRPRQHPHDPVPCGLRLVRHDADLLPADRVHQRRLADVRPPEKSYEPRPQGLVADRHDVIVGCCLARIVGHEVSLPILRP